MDDVLGDTQRKVKSVLASWNAGDEKEVFDAAERDAILLKYVIPKLPTLLRDELRIKAKDQIMTPLTDILQWAEVIRPSIFSQILETEVFPKWLDALHIWLIQPQVSFEEIA
ncbi:Tuftelin-interacting protein 11 [Mycena sanguinolenta]|uniref:Tuftelin-interacting protein 11 n=1 Tax=Mycena sanguinolenta TaxID=230812 RepID=A0A8H6Z426_9AGAR|nr:Tuftelin-interacting protein 11 [Mycena sanguinolenta]